MKINYDKVFENIIQTTPKETSLLLQVCCAPCSTAVLERLIAHFKVTLLFDNPNIYPSEEYFRRKAECERLASLLLPYDNAFLETPYVPERFYQSTEKYKNLTEGSARCFSCYQMRLEETAKIAKEKGFEYFGTTLSVSPHKNSRVLNLLGEKLEKKYGVSFLYSDFKKKGGFKRSIALSEVYELYRQDYCGCIYSKREAEERALNRENRGEK